MNDTLDDFISNLQERIFQETREAYGELGYQRWRNPLHGGAMQNPDGFAKVKGICGDTMQIFLKFEQEHVTEASFLTDGCGASAMCGSIAAELAIGKTPDSLMDVTGEKILEVLGVFPKEEQHCAFLASETLHEAVGDYIKKQLRDTLPGDREF